MVDINYDLPLILCLQNSLHDLSDDFIQITGISLSKNRRIGNFSANSVFVRVSLIILPLILERHIIRFCSKRAFDNFFPCQKSPSTNMTTLALKKSMSGLPCNSFTLTRYLPAIHKACRSLISGVVSLLFILDIIQLLFSLENWSCDICPPLYSYSIFRLRSVSHFSMIWLYLSTQSFTVTNRSDGWNLLIS